MARGETLKAHLQNADAPEIVHAIANVAKILVRLHERNITHRDIKPENLLIIDGKITIGDFGLVDFPEKEEGLTIEGNPLGPRWTIAPEMRNNPENAESKKADVYSLAKTLWILLTKVEKGFEGQYHANSSVGIVNYLPAIFNSPLDAILLKATENDPSRRPTMEEIAYSLDKWIEQNNDFYKKNKVDWNEVQYKLFPTSLPERVIWSDINAIISILNILGGIRSLNHVLFPDGGGMDLLGASLANEPGCIELDFELKYVAKPRRLIFEGFNADTEWNYFRLETHEIEAKFGERSDDFEEEVSEINGKYFKESKDELYSRYGKLPNNYKSIVRCLKGSFVLFQKTSSYNYTTSTYDGRHDTVDTDTFRAYIERVIRTGYKVTKEIDDTGMPYKRVTNGPLISI